MLYKLRYRFGLLLRDVVCRTLDDLYLQICASVRPHRRGNTRQELRKRVVFPGADYERQVYTAALSGKELFVFGESTTRVKRRRQVIGVTVRLRIVSHIGVPELPEEVPEIFGLPAGNRQPTRFNNCASWRPCGSLKVREYLDEETGASVSRPSFLALLRDARLRRFRVLLISDLDRLTREGAAAGFGYLAELDRFGVRVVSLGQSWLDYDLAVDEDPELREMRSIQTAVALA